MRALVLGIVVLLAAAHGVAAEPPSTLERIRSEGTIRLGYRDSAVPFAYVDDAGAVMGYAIDLCGKVVDAVKTRLGRPDLRVEQVPVTAANRFQMVRSRAVDIECGATTNTPARAREVAFSVTHFVTGNRFVARGTLGFDRFEDLRERTVVSIVGTENIRQVTELNRQRGLEMRVMPAPDPATAFRLLENDDATAFFWDDILLAGIVAGAHNPGRWAISDQALSVAPLALMMRRDDAAFKQLVDEALTAAFRSDEIQAIYDKWFLAPIPPKGVTLNVPVSPALKHAFRKPTDSADPDRYR